jgi:hypothetical protein
VAPRTGRLFVGLGLVGLALASLVREPIGLMGTVTAIAVGMAIVAFRRADRAALRDQLRLLLLVLCASAAPYLAVGARDALFDVEPGQLVTRHGFSDILYMGLGAVPNPFGISYDDNVALAQARQVDPDVVHCTPEFFGIMWKVYLDTVASAPGEVARIYLEKARLLLSDPILDPAPPLGVLLAVGLGHFLAATGFGLWRRVGFPRGLLVEGAALAFIGLFVVQGILASPARGYAMPAGAAILILVGILAGFCLRAAWMFLQSILGIRGRRQQPLPPLRA